MKMGNPSARKGVGLWASCAPAILALVLSMEAASMAKAQSPDSLNFLYSWLNASQFPTITSEVKVWKGDFTPIEGLTEQNFVVYENGVRQLPIRVEEFKVDSGGVSVVLVMDVSGSMEEEIDDAKAAAITFVNLLSDLDQAALVAFYEDVELRQNFTRDKQVLADAINGLTLEDGTSVYDGIMLALDLLQPIAGKRAVVVLSDGRDNSSTATLEQTVERARTAGVPIFAIGLGLKKNRGRDELIAIAEGSGGIFYDSPTSKELEEIYRRIAFILSSYYYHITYTSSNCAEDGTLREVRIDVQYNGLTATATRQYRAPGSTSLLALSASATPTPGQPFQVRIAVPDQAAQIYQLMNLQLQVQYDSRYVEIPDPIQQQVVPGALLGNSGDFNLAVKNDRNAGMLTLSIQRRSGAGPITGKGILAEITFRTRMETPDLTDLTFRLHLNGAENPRGCPVVLETRDLTLRSEGMLVWPGDTNNNGVVELTDVLQLGLYWAISGPPRPGSEDQLAWMPHLAKRFSVLPATYTDADGNGVITERDLIPIGLNWKKTRDQGQTAKRNMYRAAATAHLRLQVSSLPVPGHHRVQLMLASGDTESVQGIAFRLRYAAPQIELIDFGPGEHFLPAPLRFERHEAENGFLAAAYMLPVDISATDRPVLVKLTVKTPGTLATPDLNLEDLALVYRNGDVQEIAMSDIDMAGLTREPDEFRVYPAFPNPFNPVTTLRYYLPEPATVVMTVYNELGQALMVRRLPLLPGGLHQLHWDGRDDHHRAVGSGMYFISLQARTRNGQEYRNQQKILLLK